MSTPRCQSKVIGSVGQSLSILALHSALIGDHGRCPAMLPEHPDEIIALKPDLERFCSTQCGRSTVLDVKADFLRVYEKLPFGLLPVMMIDKPGCPDVYAIDCLHGPNVVVWCDDAVVKRWKSLSAFKVWLRDQEG